MQNQACPSPSNERPPATSAGGNASRLRNSAIVFAGGACYGVLASVVKLAYGAGFTFPQVVCSQAFFAFAVFALPSFALLLFCGFGQLAHGNPGGPLQAAALFASVAAPAALLAMALSALVGTVLPKALARIVAAVGWLAALVPLSFVGEPTAGGGIQFHIAADPVCQAFFGCPRCSTRFRPLLRPRRLSPSPCSSLSSPLSLGCSW